MKPTVVSPNDYRDLIIGTALHASTGLVSLTISLDIISTITILNRVLDLKQSLNVYTALDRSRSVRDGIFVRT